jgi:hypothetical protein
MWQITNSSSFKLAVYGPKRPGETRENSFYILRAGGHTPDGWQCDGFYVPSDVTVTGMPPLDRELAWQGPVGFKVNGARSLVLIGRKSLAVNAQPDALFAAGDIDWHIPSLSQAEIQDSPADL